MGSGRWSGTAKGVRRPRPYPPPWSKTGSSETQPGPKAIVKFFLNPRMRLDIIIIFCKRCNTSEDILSSPRIHVAAPLPRNLQGREVSSAPSPDVGGFVNKLKTVCCGIKKSFPPNWPPLILFRNDVGVAVVPYDSPRVREAQSLDDLIGQDTGFVYVRKKPFPGGTTTDCGPNGAWC